MRTSIRNSLLLTAMLLVILLFPCAAASAHTVATGNGQIAGRLLDGTNNNTPVVGQSVTLQLAQGESAQDTKTITTDAHGAFSFTNLLTDKTIGYAVYTRYQGAQYVSDLVSLATKPVQQLNLTVYDATTSSAELAIVQASVLIHTPNVQRSIITISEAVFFKNLDTRAYVGSLDGSKGKPNALRFSLPPGARSLTLSTGFNGYQSIAVDRGFASDAAVPPGDSQFAFSYDVAYTSSTYTYTYLAVYPTVQLSVMVSPDLHAASSTLTSQGMMTADQHPYHLYTASQLIRNKDVQVTLEGLQAPASTGSSALFSSSTIWLIAAVFLMLMIVVATWLYYRFKRNGPKSVGEPAKGVSSTREKALLQELLTLDKEFEAGKLTKAGYQERRAKTKARLRTVMSEQEASHR